MLLFGNEADARGNNAEVHGAGSVAQALQLMDQVQPDVLVSDIGIPTPSFDLLAQIGAHASPDTARLPALAPTAFAQPQDRQRAMDSAFQAWGSKPLDPATLVAAVPQLAAPRVTAPRLEQDPKTPP